MNEETKNAALDCISLLGCNNLFITQVKKADAFFKPRFIVAINDRNLISLNNRGTKVTNQFSWLTVKYIGRERNKLRFQFDKIKFAFEFTEEALFTGVSSALQSILTQSELKAIKFDTFRYQPVKSYSPSSAINRILERSNLLKNQIYDQTLETIRSMLIYSQPDINMSDIPGVDKFLSIILDSLPFWSNVKILSISEMGIIDPYKVTLQYASYFNSLKLLEINCKKSIDFQQFMDELSKNEAERPKNLFSLSFTRSEFEKDDLAVLQKFIIEEKIQGLELHDAISRNTILDFYTQFLNTNMMKCLTVLNLDHTKSIANDISIIAPKLSNLLALSLSDCSIEISDTLLLLSRLQKLRILNLSNNTCKKVISSLPPSITTLYMNSVNWCFQTLQLFLTNLPRHHLTLYLSNIIMQQQADYDDLFTKLPTAKTHFLKGLSWDGNRIEQSLFDFLGKNKALNFLSLSNCFSNTDEKEVEMLRKYLSQFRTVKKLIIRGTKRKFLGNLVETVIDGVLRSPQIEFLDLTQNKGGNLGMNQMRRLVTSQTGLQCFLFDRTKPTNFDTFSGFLRDSSQNKNIKISFPIKDMKSMLKKGIITDEQFNQIRSMFAVSSQPGIFYIEFYNPDFPRYFTSSEIEELKKAVVDFEVVQSQPNQNLSQNQPQNLAQNQLQNAAKSRSPNNKNTSYNMNYGTLNMKSLKSRQQNDIFGNLPPSTSQQRKSPTKESLRASQNEDKNQYLMKQNRKIAKMTPKENDTFDSASASYNQESSSNDFFIPNNYNDDFEAATVKNRPIRNNLPGGAKQTSKGTKRRARKAESLAPVKKRSRSRQQQQRIRNNNNNDDDDDIEDDNDNGRGYNQRQPNSARRPRRTRSSASQRPKTARSRPKQTNQNIFDDDDDIDNDNEIRTEKRTPRSTRGSRTARTSTSKRKPTRRQTYRNNNQEDDDDFDDYGYENDNVRPLLRSKKSSTRNRRIQENFNANDVDDYDNDNGGDEEDELFYTYQQPSWDFPIKMKFIYETDAAKRIEESYSNNAFVNAILNEVEEKERPKKRLHEY